MKFSLRAKFMLGLMVHTTIIYICLGAALLAFNLHERRMHPDEIEEEREELFVIYGLMAAVLPFATLGAWWITGQFLKPLQTILRTADEIRRGRLDQRIETPILNDELGQLARTLNQAFDNYHDVLERLDRFSLDAAHQLRNPLAAMRTSAEVCLQQPRDRAAYEEVLAMVLEEASRLGHTVDQLLLLARLTRDNLREHFETLDLSALTLTLVDHLKPAFDEKRIQLTALTPASPVHVRGSPRLLEQALANLLDNALRLTPGDGRVQVELRQEPLKVYLSVADSGPGLQNNSGNSENPKNSGLGLLVASNIARAHGGSVQAAASSWGGACFTIELPGLGEGFAFRGCRELERVTQTSCRVRVP